MKPGISFHLNTQASNPATWIPAFPNPADFRFNYFKLLQLTVLSRLRQAVPGGNETGKQLNLLYKQNFPGRSGRYFAGENYGVEGGWTEPALRSGLDCVLQMLNNVNARFKDGSFGLPKVAKGIGTAPCIVHLCDLHHTPIIL
jgi:hypothetical protein